MSAVARDHAELRRLLFGIAYRMLGSVVEAEDLVQEAFLRRERAVAGGTQIADERAFLTTAVTRLAIDHLRSARVRRESYPGPWLPEPLLTDPGPRPDERAVQRDSLSLAFLLVLERLSPVERAVFLLADVFDFPFSEIAEIVDRSEAACRQIAVRARRHLEDERPRFAVSREQQEELTERFLAACLAGDTDGLLALLADDAAAYTDGGGRARAASQAVVGARAIARFMALIAGRAPEGATFAAVEVNGRPGRVLTGPGGDVQAVLVLDAGADGRIRTVHIVVNPDKLASLRPPA